MINNFLFILSYYLFNFYFISKFIYLLYSLIIWLVKIMEKENSKLFIPIGNFQNLDTLFKKNIIFSTIDQTNH